jgi:hypothetical protein
LARHPARRFLIGYAGVIETGCWIRDRASRTHAASNLDFGKGIHRNMAEVIGFPRDNATFGEKKRLRLLGRNLPNELTVYVESPIHKKRDIRYLGFIVYMGYENHKQVNPPPVKRKA